MSAFRSSSCTFLSYSSPVLVITAIGLSVSFFKEIISSPNLLYSVGSPSPTIDTTSKFLSEEIYLLNSFIISSKGKILF